MSIYNPPTRTQSIYNPNNYGGLGVDGTITTDYLKANFLSFPVAQGTQTLVNVNLLGTITGDGEVNIDGDIAGETITGDAIYVGTQNLLTEILTNTGKANANTIDIATNTSAIATNTANIATNTTAIAGFNSSISANTANIATNTSNIGTNTSAITALQTLTNADTIRIGDLETLTASHTTDIAINTADIATNATYITALQTLNCFAYYGYCWKCY
jgi:trimeric autotransporter adhesin